MSSSIDAYRTVNVGTQSPRQVILKLYGAAIEKLAEAEAELSGGRSAEAPLAKVQSIVGGLMAALDFEAGELPRRLLQLYLFVLDRVHRTLESGRDEGLAPARRVLETVLAGWRGIPADEARRSARPLTTSTGVHLKG